jgi:hypothetical protein
MRRTVPGTEFPADADAEILTALSASAGQDMAPCIWAFGALLFALAHRYVLPDPEEAVCLALSEIRRCCPGWAGSSLPARVWIMAVAKRQFDELTKAERSGTSR